MNFEKINNYVQHHYDEKKYLSWTNSEYKKFLKFGQIDFPDQWRKTKIMIDSMTSKYIYFVLTKASKNKLPESIKNTFDELNKMNRLILLHEKKSS